ncbi:response regulator [Desulfobacterales bacterium HSG17]|nr:response regulator [Desulfobacterales bacterium HSG17]
MKTVLVIDDDLQVRGYLARMLQKEGFSVMTAENGRQAEEHWTINSFDLVITDLYMPEKEGIEIIQALRIDFPDTKVIAISGGGGGLGPFYSLKTAKFVGADLVLEKPVGKAEILAGIQSVW